MAPLPPEVRVVIEPWLSALRALLGDGLSGVWLQGSVALGGFEPAWSDIDVCVLLAEPPADALLGPVGRLHAELEHRYLTHGIRAWRSTQLLEGPYIAADAVRDPSDDVPFLQVSTGSCQRVHGDPIPGFNRFVLAHHAVAIEGTPPQIAPPTQRQLATSQAWLVEHLARPAAAHSPIMLAGLLQEGARSLRFWRDGEFRDKSTALDREIARGGPLTEAFQLARRLRRAGSAAAQDHEGALASAYERAAPSLHVQLSAYVSEAQR